MDENPKTTAFTGLYHLVESGEALLASGDLDGALTAYRQAAKIVPGGSQMEEQIALNIQRILHAKQAAGSNGPTLVQKIPASGFDTRVVVDPYQGSYQPNPTQPDWGIPPAWENQPAPPPAAAIPPTYLVPRAAEPNAYGPGSTIAGSPATYPAQDPYSYPFDQAMEAIQYADWVRAEALLSGIAAGQPDYTRSGLAVQDALAHVRNQLQPAEPQTAWKKWIIPALIGGGLALALCAIASAAGLFGYFMSRPPTPTPSMPAILAPSHTPVIVIAPTYTLPPTYTPLPTYTLQPTTLQPTNTRQPTVPPTKAPPPTQPPIQPPAASCCTLRVRNKSGGALWIGTNMPYGGSTIKPNWYVDFRLTGSQSITIWFCDVRPDGSLVNCSSKTFNVTEPVQEGSVP